MSASTFDRIIESLGELPFKPDVFFGGFGEPLLIARIAEMVARVKTVAGKVEIITNGMLLTDQLSHELIDADLDTLWVSVDGATAEHYADVRLGAALPTVFQNIIASKSCAAKPIHRTQWADLILLLSIALGAFMRLNPTQLAGFAINDGGMFAAMVDDLKTSHYQLPRFTTYNQMDIPYVYPPLGFYLGRIVSDLTGWPAPETLRWLPGIIASLSIFAFYLLAIRLLKNKYYAAVSTLFFALMPRALSWYVMGGGLTRSPGQFFMLLTLASLVRLYEQRRRIDIFLSGLFGGLAVMSHPEAAVHTIVSSVFLWLFLSRKRVDFINSIYVGLIALIVSAPWWGTVIAYHGITPILNGAATGQKFLAIFNLLFFVFTEEPYATVIAVLGLIGVARCLVRREYLLPLWLALPFFVEGRRAAGPAAIPLAMLRFARLMLSL